MRAENSVLFALADLRSLESDRVATLFVFSERYQVQVLEVMKDADCIRTMRKVDHAWYGPLTPGGIVSDEDDARVGLRRPEPQPDVDPAQEADPPDLRLPGDRTLPPPCREHADSIIRDGQGYEA